MKKNILSEVNRTREIMGLPIMEQRKETIITDVVKSDVKVPVPAIKGNYKPGKSDPSGFIENSITIIQKAINSVDGAREKLEEGNLRLVEITVKAGASNYWDKTTGPTQFDHEIVGDKYEPTTDGKGPGLSEDGYDLNMELAELRASTYIDEIKPLLGVEEGLGIEISDQLSEIPQGMVVDTGGKNDDPECTTDCGQVLILTLSFIYTDTIEKTIDICLPEIKITIGSKGKADGHECDEAVFKVSVNGTKIGVANLNNTGMDLEWDINKGPWIRSNEHAKGIRTMNNKWKKGRVTDSKFGGERSWTGTIDTTNPELNWGEDNTLTIKSLVKTESVQGYRMSTVGGISMSIVCNENPQGPIGTGGYKGQKCGSHTEVPYVIIQNTPVTEGEFVTVYDDTPNIDVARGSMKTTLLLNLDKCGNPIGGETVSVE